jgi:hypothetical protein
MFSTASPGGCVGTSLRLSNVPRKRKARENYFETLRRLSSEQAGWLLGFFIMLVVYLGLSALFEKVLHLPEVWIFGLQLVFFPMWLGLVGTMGLIGALRGEMLGKYGVVSRGVWAVIWGLIIALVGYGMALCFLVEGIQKILSA